MSTTPTIIVDNFPWEIRQTDTSWIGICDPLNIATEADSEDDLHGMIHETMHIFMLDLMEDNELDLYLDERGWAQSKH